MNNNVSVPPELSENENENAQAANESKQIEQISEEFQGNGSPIEEIVDTALQETPLDSTDEEKATGILGYVEHIDGLEIHGWVVDIDEHPLKLSLHFKNQGYQITYTWLERVDIAEKYGEKYLFSGFRIEVPQGLADTFDLAKKTGDNIEVRVNGVLLSNKYSLAFSEEIDGSASESPSASAEETNGEDTNVSPLPSAEESDGSSELIGANDSEAESDLSNPETLDTDAIELATAHVEEEPTAIIEACFEGVEKKQLSAWVINHPTVKSSPNPQRKHALNGYVERIEGLHIYGWAIDQNQEPFNLSIRIDSEDYPVTPEWFERADIAGQFGNAFLLSGFKALVPKTLIKKFLETCQKGSQIDVVAEGFVLNNNLSKDDLFYEPSFLGFELASETDKFKAVYDINKEFGIEIGADDFSKLLSGNLAYPVRISRNDSVNVHYYFGRAQQNAAKKAYGIARNLLKICLLFEMKAEFLELLGDIYSAQQDFQTASYHYEAALSCQGKSSNALLSNLMHCKKQLSYPSEMIAAMLDGLEKSPDTNILSEQFDNLIQQYWQKQQGLLEVLSVTDGADPGSRAALAAKMAEVSSFIYSAYLRFYGAQANPAWTGGCNPKRVLIVGDFHIPQCVRYRIDQKLEQFEAAGIEAEAVSWTELSGHQNTLVFYDQVIFYRVPAEPQVLKAMAQVNATGRLSLYEIDDLLFETDYPPALETYGGYLDLGIYHQLLKGMASFNAAARYCRFGIASTRPLADRLQGLVFGGQCFVHRNGTDSLNVFKSKFHDPAKETVDIFYGSGTMAHNSDFIDLALPAIARLLDERPQAGLKIAGYLKLPEAFLAKYEGRVKQMPPVKSIKAYWSMLERADINLAVLHDDAINGCKSELKWFEAACLGIPSVVSATANYRDVIRDGEDGLIAATPADWHRHLLALVDDAALRQAIAERAQARVREEYRVAALAANLKAVLAKARAAAQRPGAGGRKKIALVNVFFPPQSIGGATRVVADNFDLLQRDYADQFELSVFTTDSEHKPPHQMTQYNHQGVRVYRATCLWREHMDWHPTDPEMGKLFAEYLAAETPDLVHFHCVQRLTGSVLEAARDAGVPYIVTVHDAWWISDYQFLVGPDNTVYPDGHPDPYQPCTPPGNISQTESIERILYLKDLLRGARSVLTVSNCFAAIYRKNEIPQIRVNKNGISETLEWLPKDTRHTDRVVCGHVGGMAEHKGYFLLKAAIEAVQPAHLEMLIVDHSQDEGYRLQTHWGQVPVTFIGRMAQPRVVDLYRQLDVLFAPSTWPESYGLVTREAAACGCWVVASNMGGIGEDVVHGKSGFVIEPTLESLAECIEEINLKFSIFKGKAHSLALRRVAEQVKDLANLYHDNAEEEAPNKIEGLDFDTVFEINAEFGKEICQDDINDLLSGKINFPLRISLDDAVNADFYLELVKSNLDGHNIDIAIRLLGFVLDFKNPKADENATDACLELGDTITLEEFDHLMDGVNRYPLRISENDTINANYHFELAKHNLELGDLQRSINLLQVCKIFEHHAEEQGLAKINQIDFKTVFNINAKYGVDINIEDFSKLLSGHIGYPLKVSRDKLLNSNYYLELAKQKLISHEIDLARNLLKISLSFNRKAEMLELLGNTYFEQKDYETAAYHYQAALESEGNPSKWLITNLMHCKKQVAHPREMVEILLAGLKNQPDISVLDDLVGQYWLKQQGLLEVLAVTDGADPGSRAALAAKMAEVSSFIYSAYLRFYGADANPAWTGGCNPKRVLIVGDFHIPQCVRYRIDQKLEQFEAAGIEAEAVSWTELSGHQNTLVFYDQVIFYRVPAEPQVLKAMAQVNATGRLSLYEIDDLLFETDYPPALETYGGYLDLGIYHQLLKGMASFNAAARYCRFGIASTRPLADRLQGLVFGGQCFVHRNGTDSLNVFKSKFHDPAKETVDIFYGSGTMAHNSDFIDLALPAIARLLDERPQAGLKIAGYLKLPEAFLAKYEGRVKQMPPVKSIKAYWSMLERADINLAVLHDDAINGCKSELKWFEAACLGIPSVVSATANYRDVIRDGEDGLIAATPADWHRHLLALVDDAALRQAIAERAQARVREEYRVAALAANLKAVLAKARAAAQRPGAGGRKKIALVNVFFPPQSIGGATRVVADNFDLLQRDYADQFELSVFTTDSEHKPPHQMTQYNHQGVRVYRATCLWREHMDWHPTDPEMGKLFAEYLAAETPDLVHFHCVQRLTGSVLEAARDAGVPYIVTVHDAWWISDYQFLVGPDNTVYPDGHPDPYQPCTPPGNISQTESIERILYLKDLLRGARSVLTVSNCFAAIYRKNEIPQIRVNKNGISETLEWLPKDTRHTDRVVCGHVGGMAEHKGYFLLKAAIEAVQPAHLEMLIVDHSQDEGYRLQTHWGQVPVTFIGRMAQPRVVDLYRQLDVLFAPSTWPESYGLVTREAAACGCWVVASNMGGIGEDVVHGKSGFVIEPSIQALSECIMDIEENYQTYKGIPDSPVLRINTEQLRELTAIYSE